MRANTKVKVFTGTVCLKHSVQLWWGYSLEVLVGVTPKFNELSIVDEFHGQRIIVCPSDLNQCTPKTTSAPHIRRTWRFVVNT